MTFTLATAKTKMAAMDRDLRAVFTKHGLNYVPDGGRVGLDGSLTIKSRLTLMNVKDDSGRTSTAEAEAYKARASLLGLKPEWLGKTLTHGKLGPIRVVGLRMRTRTAHVVVDSDRGVRVFRAADFPLVVAASQAALARLTRRAA